MIWSDSNRQAMKARAAARTRFAMLAGLGLGIAVATAAPDRAPEPIKRLRLPLEEWPDRTIKTQVFADRADLAPEGPIAATGVRVEMHSRDGKLETVLTAESCRLDRATRIAESDGQVTIERPGVKVSGVGFEWNGADERVTIRSQVRVEIGQALIRRPAPPTGSGGEP